MRICVAGTFNRLHEGHRALLSRAFELGDEVFIGLTSDQMAARGREVRVLDYETRRINLKEFVSSLSRGKEFHILIIEDELGPAAYRDYDAIVVSSETKETAMRINEVRASNGLYPLDIIEIDMVLDNHGEPLSSTKVARGETKIG